MDAAVESSSKKSHACTEEKDIYSVEEVFDMIDKDFIDFYGNYGKRIVNSRRAEWNQDGFVNLKML
jgi:hypothetical protein